MGCLMCTTVTSHVNFNKVKLKRYTMFFNLIKSIENLCVKIIMIFGLMQLKRLDTRRDACVEVWVAQIMWLVNKFQCRKDQSQKRLILETLIIF